MGKIIKYVLIDILRNKIIIAYTLFLAILSFSVFSLEDSADKGLLSLLNVVLLFVPLVSIIFSTIYIYNSTEFIELLVSQPIKRKSLWLSLFGGLSIALCIAFFAGAGTAILIFDFSSTGIVLLIAGLLLSIIFAAVASLASVFTKDKAKGIGFSILLWFYFSILFDGLILFLLFQLSDYPVEKFSLAATAFNPIDLARIFVLMQMDVSALMGFTGAVFKDFFGSSTGTSITVVIMFLWILIPAWWSLKKFEKKDL